MLIIPEKRAIALKLKDPSEIIKNIPDAKIFDWRGVPVTLVPHRLEESLILKNLGIAVPSPVQYHYNWSGRYRPFTVQRSTVDMLTLYPRCFVLNDMGSGKTISALWAFDYLRQKRRVTRALIVAPLSTLERAWGDEVFRNFSHLNYAVLHGTRQKRQALLANRDFDLYIINHDGLETVVDDLAKRDDIDLVILDELAVLRNAQTNRWKVTNEICNKQKFMVPGHRDGKSQIPKIRRVWGMTGTPTPNAPTDAYGQVKLLAPERIPFGFGRFKDQVMQQFGPFLWVARPNAQKIVAEYMYPAVRFSLDDCVDLPELIYTERNAPLSAEQSKAYNQMMETLATEVANGDVVAVNEGVKASKLIQIACIEYTTPVLTLAGWKPISTITADDLVWDGEEWVSQLGAIHKGYREVVDCCGVRMTPDHKVLTTEGWATAQEIVDGKSSERFNRAEVRLPDGYQASRHHYRGDAVCDMAMPVRLREPSGAQESVSKNQASNHPTQLRVSPRQRDTQADQYGRVQRLGEDETAGAEPVRQKLAALWGQRHNCLRTMARVFRSVLSGYGAEAQGLHFGSHRQQWPVFAGELSLGYASGAIEEQENQPHYRHTRGAHDYIGSRRAARDAAPNVERQNFSVSVADRTSIERTSAGVAVYDLVECGPRNRFVVLGNDGPLIVHNCGVCYDVDGQERIVGGEARLNVVEELVEASASKTIVFCPFRSVVAYVTQQLKGRGHKVARIDGSTTKRERDTIFGQFQNGSEVEVIVAIPSCMSHGITLTAASTIVWYAPVTSNETFTQANARCHRPGQKHKCVVAMVSGTPLERRYYKRLKDKQSAQGLLLEILRTAT